MKKIAVFVEGHTESRFVERLFIEILTKGSFSIECFELTGPIQSRTMKVVRALKQPGSVAYYIMIYNCRNDGAVKADIIEQYPTLMRASYSAVIGLRDVYPSSDIVRTRQYADYGLPIPAPVAPQIVLAIMEVESWFVAEESHYSRVHPNLSKLDGDAESGIDIVAQSTECIPHPSAVLHKTYQKVGLAYHKKDWQVQRTIDALDFSNLYFFVRSRNASLDQFLTVLEGSL